jgi:ABC-type multidrug transport system fused ATPase/permease subunit
LSDSSLNDSYSRLLTDLNAAVDRRQDDEAALAAIEQAPDRPFPRQLSDEQERIQADFAQRIEAVENARSDEATRIETEFENERNRIETEYRKRIGQLESEHESRLKATEEQFEQQRWMMSSLVDDEAEDSPKRKLENLQQRQAKVRMDVGIEADHLEDLGEQAKIILEARNYSLADVPAAEVPRFASPGEAHDLFLESEETCCGAFETLKKQKFAYWCSGSRLLLLMFLLFAVVGGGLFLLFDREAVGLGDISGITWYGILAGSSLIFSTIVGLLCWDFSRRQTNEAYETFMRSLQRSRAAMAQWEKLSEREEKKAQAAYEKHYRKLIEHRERSIQKFERERDETIEKLAREIEQKKQAAEEHKQQQVAPLEEKRRSSLQEIDERYSQQSVQLQSERDAALAAAEAQYQQRVQVREQQLQQAQQQLSENWLSGLNAVTELCRTTDARVAEPTPWEALSVDQWTSPTELPSELPIGMFGTTLKFFENGPAEQPFLPDHETDWTVRAALPFPEQPSVIINYDGGGRAEAEALLQVMMIRLLMSIPPGNVRFTVLDPVGLGEPFSSFMHLADDNELLITNRIWTEPSQIDKQLADLTEHMENIFQTYLRNQFATIEEYNEYAGEVAEPYRVLVVSGFPQSFSERAAQRLASIAASGPRCGVYLLLSRDTTRNLPRDFDPASIAGNATIFDWKKDHFETTSFGEPPLVFSPDDPPPPSIFSSIVKKIGKLSTTLKKVEVPFHRIAPDQNEFWKSDSRSGIDIPLGRAGATRLQHLKLGQGTSQHVLVAGRTGSGKSTLLHIMITNAALHYSPQELEFYLIDFKKGVEFKTYATHHLPHARVIAIESDREFGLSALQKLDDVMKQRGDMFRNAGVQDIAGWRNDHPDQPLPRIILMIDEFQEFFVEDDRISQNAALMLDRLVRQGRAFGIHVLLGSQTLGGAYSLARTTLSQMGVRIALQCSESDAHLILSEENSAARLLTRPGEAIYNDANGMVEGNTPFQIAWLDDEERETRLDKIQHATEDLIRSDSGYTETDCVVFEGNILADPALNSALVAQIRGEATTRKLWLGDPVTIDKPAYLSLEPQPGQNVLVVGNAPEDVEGLLAVGLLSSVAENSNGYLLEGGSLTDTGWTGLIDRLKDNLVVAMPRQADAVLEQLAAELQERQNDPDRTMTPITLLVTDVTKFAQLRRSDEDFGFGSFDKEKTVSPAARFQEILKDGPSYGLHTILWCRSYSNFDRWLGRSFLREFEYRIAFQMSGTDSSNLVDSPAAGRLGRNRALLYRDSLGSFEKFRPYRLPKLDWLDSLIQPQPAVTAEDAGNDEPEIADDLSDFQVL